MTTIRAKYEGTALPTNSDTFTLWDSTENNAHNTGKSADVINMFGLKWANVRVECSHKGTLHASWSDDDGTEWNIYDQRVMPASGTNMAHHFSIPIVGYRDVKIEWVNGGTTQTNFDVLTTLSTEQDNIWQGGRHFPAYMTDTDYDGTPGDTGGDWIQVGPEKRVAFHITTAAGTSPVGTNVLQGTWDGGTSAVEIDNASGEFDTNMASLDDTAIFTNVECPFVRLYVDYTSGTIEQHEVRASTS